MSEDKIVPSDSFIPALVVGYFDVEGETIGGKIGAAHLRTKLPINPLTTAGMMISVYNCCENLIPEPQQNNFEKDTLELFVKMLEERWEILKNKNEKY